MNQPTATLLTTRLDRLHIAERLFWAVFWVTTCVGFVADEWLSPMTQLRSAATLLCEAAIITAAVMVVKNRIIWWLIAAFIALTWITTTQLNPIPTGTWLNGLREFIGLATAYPVAVALCREKRETFLNQLDRNLLIFLCLQMFCIPYQFFLYGSGDLVGGSLGQLYSGQISICIYLASFFLIRRRLDYDNLFQSVRKNWYLPALLLPTFLNETKVSFILLPLYILLLLPLDRKLLTRLVVTAPLMAGALWIGAQIYNTTTKDLAQGGGMFKNTEEAYAYFMFENLENTEAAVQWDIDNIGHADVPRLTKLMFLTILNELEPGHVITGFGLGHFKGNVIGATDFARQYDWLLSGSIPYVFHIYIQLGLIGIALLIAYCTAVFARAPLPHCRRDVPLQLLLAFIVALTFLYNDALRHLSFCIFLFSLLSASWIPNQQTQEP